ncbi:helix-turn-helix transcriptional regulator [Anaerocolumna aminovalerica]|uniref:helix-turn-helix transcriptional regulator n=1 Tax=Anaerocolumna aminovalerica TaxID=1527 RepID=UPI001C0EBB9A|nr:helix-turn-helix transcriptional regulator [Anaerocolumna aminovalerica]MBU5333596.1 helix-turn-helix transcriptional regulator [Anaerocolumna aminovalerica]
MSNLKLATLRKQNEWTQLEVAKRIGITKAAYSNIETGKRNPSYAVTVKLQNLFNESIDKLLDTL